jgi:flagellar biosynthetic protein FliR
MEWFKITPYQVQQFFFIFLRVGVILFFVPIFSNRFIPIQVKVALSLIISLSLFSFLAHQNYNPFGFDEPVTLILAIIREIMVGIIIGFTARLIFAAIQLGGQMMGFQMGFGMVNIIDPVWQTQVSIMSQWTTMIAILIFLTINAHHLFIRALIKSFEVIPIAGVHFSPTLTENLVYLSSNMFAIALKIAAPMIATILFTHVVLGIIAKTVPQMNVFIIGFPIKIAVGLFIFILTLPFIVSFISGLFRGLGADIWRVLSLMGD